MQKTNNALDKHDYFVMSSERMREMVAWFRRLGFTRDKAVAAGAETCGVSYDMAWRLNYQHKAPVLSRHWWEQIERGYARHLDAQIAEMERATEGLRIRKQQIQLFLGECGCSENGGGTSGLSAQNASGEQPSCEAITLIARDGLTA